MKKTLFATCCLLFIGLSLTGCKDDNEPKTPEFDPEWLGPEMPTDDQLNTKANGKIHQFGDASKDALAMALINRSSGKDDLFHSPNEVTNVLICNDAISSLTNDGVRLIVKHFLAGKSILLVNPTTSTWNELATKLAEVYQSMLKEMVIPSQHSVAAETFLSGVIRDVKTKRVGSAYGLPAQANANIIAIRGNEIRTYHNDFVIPEVTVNCEQREYNEEGYVIRHTVYEPETFKNVQQSSNGYQTGLMADNLAEWLNKDPVKSENLSDAQSDLKNLMSAQKFTRMCYFSNSQAGSNYNTRYYHVETNYYIWAVYDFDHDEDYYLIHQVHIPHHGELGCSDRTKRDWDHWDKDHYVYFGCWACDINNKVSLTDKDGNVLSEGAQMIDVEPTTYSGSTSHTTGMSWSVNGNLGFAKTGPSGGISGGVTFSESYTTSVPDYKTEQNTFGPTSEWKFIAGNARIQGHYSTVDSQATHDQVPSCYRNDCTFNQSWKYIVRNPKDTYKLHTETNNQLMWYKGLNTWFYMDDYTITQSNMDSYDLEINPPVRFRNDWYMNISVPEGISSESVRNFMEKHYPKYWKESFTNYGFTADDYSGLDLMMNNFKQDIINDLISWKDAGFTGEFTISIHPSTSSTVYSKIEFKVE